MSLNALPPNKTVALAYLDGIGAQPPRYAQATLRFHCSLQEWMIGPLPISNATTATRLDFMYNGNATMKLEDCNLLGGRASVLRASNEPLGRSGEQMVHDDLTAPIAVAPDGARYEFDPRQNYVSWSMSKPLTSVFNVTNTTKWTSRSSSRLATMVLVFMIYASKAKELHMNSCFRKH